jgi:hypothetical protein
VPGPQGTYSHLLLVALAPGPVVARAALTALSCRVRTCRILDQPQANIVSTIDHSLQTEIQIVVVVAFMDCVGLFPRCGRHLRHRPTGRSTCDDFLYIYRGKANPPFSTQVTSSRITGGTVTPHL